ncbi:MAG: plastocyanin/azurin family copper-binding protein [Armatimonadota bacterium]|nr:plastocyanin/azurin family copper-binding protein [Armatimonadota bacterium]MDR7565674.1 plastocyanin/azurin family copper-binding protein [Armatimonadota bacterium]
MSGRFWLVTALLVLVALAGPAAPAAKQKVTVTMGEDGPRMFFRPAQVTLQAGVETEIVLVNRGKLKHEFMVYAPPKPGTSRDALHEWAEDNNYFKALEVKVEGSGLEVEAKELIEIELAPGRSAEVKFTPKKTGTFEMACLVKDPVDHYQAGMKGTLVVK